MLDDYAVSVRGNIRRHVVDGKSWFVARDLAPILGKRDAYSATSGLPADAVRLCPIESTNGTQLMRCITRQALEWLVARSMKAEAADLARSLGLAVVYAPSTTNTSVDIIRAALAHLPQITEHRVGPYSIDLYLPSLKVAVECDEHDHSRYDVDREVRRQVFIAKRLSCRFVRYNPHAPGFNVGAVINRIIVPPAEPPPLVLPFERSAT